MVAIDASKAQRALLKKGFQLVTGKDHLVLELVVDGKVSPVRTKFSHNGQELHDYLLSAISKQLCCSRADWMALIQCTLTGVEYLQLLKEKGVV